MGESNTLLIIKEHELCPVLERCRFTVPFEDAGARCRCDAICEIACPTSCLCEGFRWQDIDLRYRKLAKYTLHVAETWKDRYEKAGFPCHYETMRLHGPWPSRDLNERLVDYASPSFRQTITIDGITMTDLAPTVGHVHDYDPWAWAPYSDYVLTATFLKPEFRQWTWAGG